MRLGKPGCALAASVMMILILAGCSGKLPKLDMEVQHSDIYVEKNEAVGDDFVMGVDISSYISEIESGVVFYDYDGNALDEDGFYELLAQSGVTHVRIRIWNNPYDSDGRSFGGGHNDVETAVRIAKGAKKAGLKLILDFHYSDFWADPSKQMAPANWEEMDLEQKGDALYSFTEDALSQIGSTGAFIDIVQIGNETTNGFCGETKWEDMTYLMSRGSSAVRNHDSDIRIAMHFANPERENAYEFYADQLDSYGVDYDIFASSYYPYWHGTLENLTRVLRYAADTYGKQVMVVECSWAYTFDDGDGFPNTIGSLSLGVEKYKINEQGQADMLSSVVRAVTEVGDMGTGVCYWEPAWIPVQVALKDDGTIDNSVYESNKILWNRYGSGWASVFADEYDPEDAGQYYGGSAVDNQALFDFYGHPLESLRVFHYIRTGTDAPKPAPTATPTPTPAIAAIEGDVIVNGSFEGGLDGWEVNGFNTEDAASNSRNGNGSLHFYSAGGGETFTAMQEVELEEGTYTLSAWLEGGDSGSSDTFSVSVEIDGTVYEAEGTVSGWQQWSELNVPGIPVDSDTSATVVITVSDTSAGVWGAFDDVTLVKE